MRISKPTRPPTKRPYTPFLSHRPINPLLANPFISPLRQTSTTASPTTTTPAPSSPTRSPVKTKQRRRSSAATPVANTAAPQISASKTSPSAANPTPPTSKPSLSTSKRSPLPSKPSAPTKPPPHASESTPLPSLDQQLLYLSLEEPHFLSLTKSNLDGILSLAEKLHTTNPLPSVTAALTTLRTTHETLTSVLTRLAQSPSTHIPHLLQATSPANALSVLQRVPLSPPSTTSSSQRPTEIPSTYTSLAHSLSKKEQQDELRELLHEMQAGRNRLTRGLDLMEERAARIQQRLEEEREKADKKAKGGKRNSEE